ncbi:hypothetical protein IQ235_03190 [Oscillatoriales cyanobacterium LEGE 11467]|uniref:Uncharacterized protein n=1 Tax=Zarconia navalis LEGE 11467 TaxID=1828826 RepID=A0A928VW31_9CYAN|nr:hypothetical protein [Zarconia navalis LEGE 11467]
MAIASLNSPSIVLLLKYRERCLPSLMAIYLDPENLATQTAIGKAEIL